MAWTRAAEAVLGADRERPGFCGRGQPGACRDRVPAQLGHIVAGRLDVHGAHLRPGRPQQPDRCLQQASGHLGVRGGPAQPAQQLLVAENPQPQRHRPVARVIGQHDELLVQPPVGHVTPVRGPCGPEVMARENDADSRHGDPPADSEAAIRLTLISVRRPATGYPPAAAPGQELLIHDGTAAGHTGPRTAEVDNSLIVGRVRFGGEAGRGEAPHARGIPGLDSSANYLGCLQFRAGEQ